MGEDNLIFVTVGQTYGFDRLVKEMDEIAGKIDEQVVIQIGNSKYLPKNAKYFRYIRNTEIGDIFTASRFVVSHAGVGSILSILKYSKPMVILPRMKKYGEAVDDHQLQVAIEMEREGIALVVYDIKDLENIVLTFRSNFNKEFKQRNTLSVRLKEYLDDYEKLNRTN